MSIKNSLQKGFTLIELLIVIAIIAILGGSLLFILDPIDKIAAANDSKAQADILSMGKGAVAYATTHNGAYPATPADMGPAGTGDIKSIPTPGTAAYNYTYVSYPSSPACTSAAGNCVQFLMYGTLQSNRYKTTGTKGVFIYDSVTNKTCVITPAQLTTDTTAYAAGTFTTPACP